MKPDPGTPTPQTDALKSKGIEWVPIGRSQTPASEANPGPDTPCPLIPNPAIPVIRCRKCGAFHNYDESMGIDMIALCINCLHKKDGPDKWFSVKDADVSDFFPKEALELANLRSELLALQAQVAKKDEALNVMIDTPRTDYAFEGDNSVGTPPEITTWKDAKDFARTLERELAIATADNATLKDDLIVVQMNLNSAKAVLEGKNARIAELEAKLKELNQVIERSLRCDMIGGHIESVRLRQGALAQLSQEGETK